MPKHQQLIRALTVSDFQDGKPSKEDGDKPSFSLSLIARGKTDLHSEKSMNGVRMSLGLYSNYPLANSMLMGSHKRYVLLHCRPVHPFNEFGPHNQMLTMSAEKEFSKQAEKNKS